MPEAEVVIAASPDAWDAVAARLADALQPGDIVGLTGALGVGKSTLARAMLRHLGVVGDIPSPTFPIFQPYEDAALRVSVGHADLYRLSSPDELDELGFDEWLADGALIAEWPAFLLQRYPGRVLDLSIAVCGDGARVLTARVPHGWTARCPL